MIVTELKQILKSVCTRNQARKAIQSHNILLTDSDHDLSLIRSNLETLLNMREILLLMIKSIISLSAIKKCNVKL